MYLNAFHISILNIERNEIVRTVVCMCVWGINEACKSNVIDCELDCGRKRENFCYGVAVAVALEVGMG